MVANFCILELCQGKLNWPKENLRRQEVDKFLFDTENKERPVLHLAANFCKLEEFLGILYFAKKTLTKKKQIKFY